MPTLLLDRTDAEFARIVDELTRRGFLAGGLGGAALLALGACDSSGSADDPSSSGSVPATRVITTAHGPLTVPTNPTRVVCVDTQSVADLLDVGFHPVGALAGLENNLLPTDHAAYARITKIGDPGQVDIEKVAALEPDLIIGLDYGQADPVYDKLAALAPTAYFSFATTGDWSTIATAVPDAVNLAGKVVDLESAYTAHAAQLKQTHAGALASTKWAIVNGLSAAQFTLWLPDSDAGQVLSAIGGRFVGAAAGRTGDETDLSIERIDLLADADVILIGADANGDMYPDTKTLTQQQNWRRLAAAKRGNVYPLSRLFPYSYGQANALLDQLDQVLSTITTKGTK